MKRTVLVTGSKGFIGTHVSEFLKKKNYEVFETGDSSQIDLCDTSQVMTLPATDVIIHLAAKSFVPDSFKTPAAFYRNNFLSSLNVLELAKRNNSKIIFFSTYVYGAPCYLPIDEMHPVSALNPYTQSKLICEELCQSYSRDFGLPIVVFRPFNVYGPGQNSSFLIPKIIGHINNDTIQLGDPLPKRDFIFIEDILDAVELSISGNQTSFEIFNLGSGHSISVNDLVQLILQISKSRSKVVFSNMIRQGEIMETIANISKAKKYLAWTPKTTLIEGLSKTILASKSLSPGALL
jgi:UDP-glucose 4-epimerase